MPILNLANRWLWERSKRPYINYASTIGLGFFAYYVVLPTIAITALSLVITTTSCIVGGFILGSFLGWMGKKIGFIKPDPLPKPIIPQMELPKFKELPKSLKLLILGNINARDLTRAAITSRTLHETLKPDVQISKFLHHVARGEQDQAEAMLKADVQFPKEGKEEKRAGILSKLLTQAGVVTDLAGRSFGKITAFEYALWAKDRHMWEMLLKYLPPGTALAQYKKHQKSGVTYQLNGKTITELHYDFSPLKSALRQSAETTQAYMALSSGVSLKSCQTSWLNVGKMQRYVPAHIANEYVRQDRSFIPTPTFDEPSLPRTLQYNNLYTGARCTWFSDPLLGNSEDGISIYRSERVIDRLQPPNARGVIDHDEGDIRRDLEAIIALEKRRTLEYDQLVESLVYQLERPADYGNSLARSDAVSFMRPS